VVRCSEVHQAVDDEPTTIELKTFKQEKLPFVKLALVRIPQGDVLVIFVGIRGS
jgi:hypothetical protein